MRMSPLIILFLKVNAPPSNANFELVTDREESCGVLTESVVNLALPIELSFTFADKILVDVLYVKSTVDVSVTAKDVIA